jgi:hypothetical protein
MDGDELALLLECMSLAPVVPPPRYAKHSEGIVPLAIEVDGDG